MVWTSRWPAAAVVCLLALGGCELAGPSPSPSPSSTPSAPSPLATPAWDLTLPGNARRAVEQLVGQAGELPIIKVDINQSTAHLSAINDSGKVVAWVWEKGVIAPAESDVEYVGQSSFVPSDYELSDLGALFRVAAGISGSSSTQELQIVEYNRGQVLMTVTTRPESMPVFFRADATPINRLDFATAAGFTEAIRDATRGRPRALAMGWSSQGGLWADVAGGEDGVVQRTTRQAKVPAWTANRKADNTGPTFPVDAVRPEVLARLVTELPVRLDKPTAQVSFTIGRTDRMAMPVVTWDVGGSTVVTTLAGTDVTKQMGA